MSDINFKNDVLFAQNPFIKLRNQDIESLRAKVQDSRLKRVRLCAHLNIEDSLHEMFIALVKESYIRPHKHLNKVESLHILEGQADAVFFDEKGNVTKVVSVGDYSSGNHFFYRISEPTYHTLLVKSDFLIFHEVTEGPFRQIDTRRASWAPDDDDILDGREYMERLAETVSHFSLQEKALK
jgi:cupin fold WbuC family metalloprotein